MKRLLRITLHIFAFVAIALLSSVGITLIARSMGISTADNDLAFAVVNVAISLTLLILLSIYERVACGDLPSVDRVRTCVYFYISIKTSYCTIGLSALICLRHWEPYFHPFSVF